MLKFVSQLRNDYLKLIQTKFNSYVNAIESQTLCFNNLILKWRLYIKSGGEANPEPDQVTLENENKIKILELLESSPHSTDFT